MLIFKKTVRIFFLYFLVFPLVSIDASESLQESILFVRASDAKILHQKNKKLSLIPASVSKLFTAAYALKHFGANHQFATQFFYTGSKKNGIISGDLVIKGGGDALLCSEDLWKITADLKNYGIKKIKGNLVIDSSLFTPSSKKQLALKSSVAYTAPVSALGVNFNAYTVSVAPGDKVGNLAHVSFDPYDLKGIVLQNNIKTIAANKKTSIHIERFTNKGKEKILVKGHISLSSKLRKKYVSTSLPDYFVAQHFRAFLSNAGILIEGTDVYSSSREKLHLIMDYKGKPLYSIVKSLNYYSNNFIADVLVKNLEYYPQKNHLGKLNKHSQNQNGLDKIRSFILHDLSIQSPYTFNSGSGLDISNRLNAEQVVNLLSYMHKDKELFYDFVSSLAKSAASGTLLSRFKENQGHVFQNIVRAKTGTLTEPVLVSSLAGYINHPKHNLVFFAMIQNVSKQDKRYSTQFLQNYQEKYIHRVFKKI